MLPTDLINSQSLVISSETILSPEEIRFNKLIDRIEKARLKRIETEQLLQAKLEISQRIVQPLFSQLCEAQVLLIEDLIQYCEQQRLSSTKKEYIKAFCMRKFEALMTSPHGLSSERIDQLHRMMDAFIRDKTIDSAHQQKEKKNTPKSYAQRAAEIEEAINYIRDQFAETNIQIDFTGINADLTDDEVDQLIQQRVHEAIEREETKRAAEREARKAKKKPTAKQTEKATFDALTDKGFNALYKSLAKVLHPDTEQDEKLREIKMEWMKKLTHAYQTKDLKTLLLIELEWATHLAKSNGKLDDDKLKHYNKMLANQARSFEDEVRALYYEPRFKPLLYFAQNKEMVRAFNGKYAVMRYERQMQEVIAWAESLHATETSAKSLIKEIIAEEKKAQQEYDPFVDVILNSKPTW